MKILSRLTSGKVRIIIRQFHKVFSIFPFKCPMVKKSYTLQHTQRSFFSWLRLFGLVIYSTTNKMIISFWNLSYFKEVPWSISALFAYCRALKVPFSA